MNALATHQPMLSMSHAASAATTVDGPRISERPVGQRLEDLAEMLKSPDFARRAVPRLIACLRDPVVGIRQIAVRLLEGLQGDAVPLLIEATESEQPRCVRLQAIAALGRLAEVATPANGVLAQSLQDTDRDIRWQAAFALARTGESGVLTLMKALDDSSARVREIAAIGLGFAQTGRGVAQQRLAAQAATEPDLAVRAACLGALTRLREEQLDAALCEQWRTLIHHAETEVRREALTRLSEAGTNAQPLTHDVMARAADQDATVRAAAVLALARLRCPLAHVQPVFDTSADDSDAIVRGRVVIAASSYHDDDPSWADALLARLANDTESRVALAASAAQTSIRTRTQDAEVSSCP